MEINPGELWKFEDELPNQKVLFFVLILKEEPKDKMCTVHGKPLYKCLNITRNIVSYVSFEDSKWKKVSDEQRTKIR